MDSKLLFSVDAYPGPDNFCDREEELERLMAMWKQGRNGVLYSYRRMGKTGLIQHFHHHLNKKRKIVTVYLDVMDTSSDMEFVQKIITSTLQALEHKKKGLLKNALTFFSQLRPTISIDPITQLPSIQLDTSKAAMVVPTLKALMNLLANQPYEFQIAIDEFQQIANYKGNTVIDATLRSYFPTLKNVHFLFSGSERNLLLNLFSNPLKPLYASIEFMNLEYIDRKRYSAFIKRQFKKARKASEDEAIEEILRWTNGHTFYTQYLCSKILSTKKKLVTLNLVNQIKDQILYQYEVIYINYKKLLSKNQWKVLVAVAKEGTVSAYTAKAFLNKYNLSQSSTKQSIEALTKKSMLIEELTTEQSIYKVYDVYLWRWAEKYGRIG